ncbi:MAG: DUF3850 domain-containing protein [Moorea sp. SIO4G2]|nr:DUF3850 domain-containing protein [Moorena sp. SIO4G2]
MSYLPASFAQRGQTRPAWSFGQGQSLCQKSTTKKNDKYTGMVIDVEVTHILRGFEGLTPGFVIMSFKII